MKDKASQKTEEEILDQTFGGDDTIGGYDEDMTANTQDADGVGAESSKGNKKKSSSSNMLLFVGGGAAAVLVVVYMFVLKPMMAPQQNTARSVAPPAPVVAQQDTPPPQPAAPASVPPSEERSKAQDFLTGGATNPPAVSDPALAAPVTPAPVVVPNYPTVAGQDNTSAGAGTDPTLVPGFNTGVPASASPTGAPLVVESSSAITAELMRRFELNSQQFQTAISDLTRRVESEEQARVNQDMINKNVEDRLSKLEAGKSSSTASASSTNSAPTVKKTTTVKKTAPRTSVRKTSPAPVSRADGSEGSNVLVDKSSNRVYTRSQSSAEPTSAPLDYNIHSIYGSRVWIKNSDGSLSTFSSGDRLPGGEVIKSIDDESFSVKTDKRTIHKK